MLTVPRAVETEISAQKQLRYDGKEDIQLRKHLTKQRECFEKGAMLMGQLIDRDISGCRGSHGGSGGGRSERYPRADRNLAPTPFTEPGRCR